MAGKLWWLGEKNAKVLLILGEVGVSGERSVASNQAGSPLIDVRL